MLTSPVKGTRSGRNRLAIAVALCCAVHPNLVVGQTGSLQDLGSVLASRQDLSQYYDLIKKYPNILLQLPSYSGVTIIAPNNDAFDNIPGTALNGVWDESNAAVVTPILEYHILQGTVATNAIETGPSIFASTLLTDPAWTNVTGGQKVIINKQPGDEVVFESGDGTRVSMTDGDISFTGGLIQVVDNLLIPPSRLNQTLQAFQAQSFLGALYAGKVYDDFDAAGNVTIFVPRNQAFQMVNGTLSTLDTESLSNIVKYHLVPNHYLPSMALLNSTSFNSSSGAELHITQSGNNVFVNSAQIVQPDILISNGVMHIIDNVLNPNVSEATPNPDAATQAPVYAGATSASGKALPFTTALPCTQDCPVTTSATGLSVTSTHTSSSTGLVSSSSSHAAGVAGPRCTGLSTGGWGVGANVAIVAGLAAMGI